MNRTKVSILSISHLYFPLHLWFCVEILQIIVVFSIFAVKAVCMFIHCRLLLQFVCSIHVRLILVGIISFWQICIFPICKHWSEWPKNTRHRRRWLVIKSTFSWKLCQWTHKEFEREQIRKSLTTTAQTLIAFGCYGVFGHTWKLFWFDLFSWSSGKFICHCTAESFGGDASIGDNVISGLWGKVSSFKEGFVVAGALSALLLVGKGWEDTGFAILLVSWALFYRAFLHNSQFLRMIMRMTNQ